MPRTALTRSRALVPLAILLVTPLPSSGGGGDPGGPAPAGLHPVEVAAPVQLGSGKMPDIFAQSNGRLHAAWMSGTTAIKYRLFTGSAWQTTVDVPVGGRRVSTRSAPDVAADPQGNPHIVWAPNGGPVYYIYFNGSSWPTPEVVTRPGDAIYPDSAFLRDCRIAVDSQGRRHVVWRGANPVGSPAEFDIVYYRQRSSSGNWGSITNLSQNPSDRPAKRPHVALGSDDSFHVTWRGRGGVGNSYQVFYRKWSGSSWGTIEMATNTDSEAGEDSHIDVDSQNRPHISWPDEIRTGLLHASYINRVGGSWSATEIAAPDVGIVDPVIAIDSNDVPYVIYADQFTAKVSGGWTTPAPFDAGAELPDAAGGSEVAHIVYEKGSNGVYYTSVSAGGPPAPSLTVTSPNGGEVLPVGESHTVTWTSTGSVGNVAIDYSTNSGSNWTVVSPSTANDGSYSWMVPDTPTTHGRVRVREASDGNPSDISNADFTIGSPPGGEVITVTSPNGGETWAPGSSHAITWTSQGAIANVKIHYSTNNGSNWTRITASAPNTGSYTWTVPNTPSTQAIVRVRDAADNTPSDQSDAVFTIGEPPPPGNASIRVTSPNGGEVWGAGSSHAITWTSTGSVGLVRIRFFDGATWTYIARNQANDGSFTWVVPNTPTTEAVINVRTEQGADPFASDISDDPFSITGTSGAGASMLQVGEGIPSDLSLSPNYPNPFNPSTTLRFSLPAASTPESLARMTLFTLRGAPVKTLFEAPLPPGTYEVHWDGRDESGQPVPSGIYLALLEAEGHRVLRRMALLR